MRRPALILLLAAATLAACGGGGGDDREEAEQAVREFVEATNERDADRLCNELLTDEFVEQTTGATGDQAKKACEQQLKQSQRIELDLVDIAKTEVEGDDAKVTATIAAQGQTQDRVLRLKKEGGDWRLAGGSGQ